MWMLICLGKPRSLFHQKLLNLNALAYIYIYIYNIYIHISIYLANYGPESPHRFGQLDGRDTSHKSVVTKVGGGLGRLPLMWGAGQTHTLARVPTEDFYLRILVYLVIYDSG